MPTRKLGQYRGPLDASQIADGINAATRNARRLADDAKLLLEKSRVPSAAALAILSIEESGKVSILRGLSVASASDLKSQWKAYRSHTRKNVMGGFLDEVVRGARKLDDFAGLFETDAEYPQVLDQLKQVALYTDCLGKAHWSEPDEVIDNSLAEQLVTTADMLARAKVVSPREMELWIEHLGPVWKQDPQWVRKALENWYEAMQRDGLAPKGPNAMRRFMREGVLPKKAGD